MATPTRLMTFAEFEQLTELEGVRYELHHGELVEMPFSKLNRQVVQNGIADRFARATGGSGFATIEFGFRGLPDREYRRADVAYVSPQRWESADKTG